MSVTSTALPAVCWHPDAENRDKGITAEDKAIIAAVVTSYRYPISICETGAFPGTITRTLLDAMSEGSMLYSWENDPNFCQALTGAAKDDENWRVMLGSPQSYDPYHITVIDSSPYDFRNEEIERWNKSSSSLLIVHDIADERWDKTSVLAELKGVELGQPWGIGIYSKLS